MRLKITEISFTTEEEWLFKLSDGNSDYYILSDGFYRDRKMKSPISKKELDILDVGHSILCETKRVDEINVVTKII